MKQELCYFSGYKIHPGHGKRYARVDGKVFNFLNNKCQACFMMKCNPRKTNWTVLYRRKNRKGTQEEVAKKRSRRTTKFHRAIAGLTLEQINAKRNQKPEVRKAQREQAIKAANKKAAPVKLPVKQSKQKASANPKTKAPRVSGKR